MYIHTYIHACMHACMHAYIHTYVRTYIHTYIYIYMHTYVCVLHSYRALRGAIMTSRQHLVILYTDTVFRTCTKAPSLAGHSFVQLA